MLRFSIIPCIAVIIMPVLVMVVMRVLIDLFRSGETGYGGRVRGSGRFRRRIPRASTGWRRSRRVPPPIGYGQDDRGRNTWGFGSAGGRGVCPNELCGYRNRPEARFCARCGTQLA
jgi:hypothetical protein